jgi:hypothetical protein
LTLSCFFIKNLNIVGEYSETIKTELAIANIITIIIVIDLFIHELKRYKNWPENNYVLAIIIPLPSTSTAAITIFQIDYSFTSKEEVPYYFIEVPY